MGRAAKQSAEALNKGRLKDTAYAQLMLGISLYNQKKIPQAADSVAESEVIQ